MGVREDFGTELCLSPSCDPGMIAATLRNHFPHLSVEARCRFKLASCLVPRLQTHHKETTIRYSRNAVEYPVACDLPAYEDRHGDDSNLQPIGSLRIVALRYKTFGALDEGDANRDGFGTASELKLALNEFYGEIDDAEVVSIYAIHFVQSPHETMRDT